MTDFNAAAPILAGLGLFFIGVRMLAANLVPLFGPRARARFARALQGPVSSALSGVIAGLLTQSSTAVSWTILGLVRAGLAPAAWLLSAPAWSNVGTALLPILAALDFSTAASLAIGIIGFAIYFGLDKSDRRRNALEAVLGAALLLFGMHIVSAAVAPVQGALGAHGPLAALVRSPVLLALSGVACALATQSSSVATALAVAGASNGLLGVPAALPLIAGANFSGVINNFLKLRGESAAGRTVFGLQIAQKLGGSVLLVVAAVLAVVHPPAAARLMTRIGHPASAQIAGIFTLAQVAGALLASAGAAPLTAMLARRYKPSAEEALAQPAFLLNEALADPPAALDLALRELARLTDRLPQLLDHVRESPDPQAPSAGVLRAAGLELAERLRGYLVNLLDRHPNRTQVAAALLLESATANVRALHEALAEVAGAAVEADDLPAANRIVEALHVIMGFLADYARAPADEEPDFLLRLLGDRNAMMSEVRQRLTAEEGSVAQDALFRMTILFERAIWLARRVVTELAQMKQVLGS